MEFTLLKYKPQPWQPNRLTGAGGIHVQDADGYERKGDPSRGGRGKGRPGTCQGSFQRRILDDHFVVGDPNVKEKANTNADDDEDDEDEMDSEDVLKAKSDSIRGCCNRSRSRILLPLLAGQVEQWLRAGQHDIRGTLGSNNWVVKRCAYGNRQTAAGKRYASGTDDSTDLV